MKKIRKNVNVMKDVVVMIKKRKERKERKFIKETKNINFLVFKFIFLTV